MSTILGYKDLEFRKSEFVANTQFFIVKSLSIIICKIRINYSKYHEILDYKKFNSCFAAQCTLQVFYTIFNA